MDHIYDGIREYDNPTPGWWHLIFLGTVFFSMVYGVFFHSSELAWTEQDTLTKEETAYFEKLFGEIGTLQGDEATILRMMNDPKWLKVGKSVFQGNCTACHGAEGGGVNGPNMTDDSYKNVKHLADVYRVITEGVVDKGMPAWRNRLQQNQRVVAAAYIASLRGTRVSGGKAAEGDVIAPWPSASAAPAASATPARKGT
jgi:cytochrome c oxidase cbb3-type subunit 3